MTEWKTIKTAPKDGRWLLLWCGWEIVGHWVEDGKRVKKGWSDDPLGVNPIFRVTHWMPLPEPPE